MNLQEESMLEPRAETRQRENMKYIYREIRAEKKGYNEGTKMEEKGVRTILVIERNGRENK